jgi:hypothetical protein
VEITVIDVTEISTFSYTGSGSTAILVFAFREDDCAMAETITAQHLTAPIAWKTTEMALARVVVRATAIVIRRSDDISR